MAVRVRTLSKKVNLFHAMARHKWIVVSTIAASTFMAASFCARQVPLFMSSSRILFMQAPRSDEASGFGSPAFNGYLRAQAELLNSGPVLDIAAVKLRDMHLASLDRATDPSSTIAGQLQVSPDTDNGVVTVTCLSPVASDGAMVVNTVVDAYQTFAGEVLRKSDRSTVQFLQVEKDKHDALLSAANKELTQFKALHPDFAFVDSNGKNIYFLKLEKLNDELTDAQTNLINLNAKYTSAVALIPPAPQAPPAQTASADITPNDELDSDASWLQSELQRTTANIGAMESRGVPASNPNAIKAHAYEVHLRLKLADCQRITALTQLKEIKTQLDLAKQREAELQKAVVDQRQVAAAINAQITESTNLTDEAKRAQRASEEIDARLKAITTTTDLPPEARILERARPGQSPRSTTLAIIGIASAAGLLLGSGFAYTIERLDTRLRSPEEVSALLGLPVLGIFPHQRGETSLEVLGTLSHSNSMSPLADGACRVRAAIFAASRTTPALTIVVTSPIAGDGKSVVAANLAVVMAQAGVRTLLIDANFKSPGTAKIFDLQRSAGLSDVISGKVTLDRAIRRTPVERLEVLSAGGSAEVLTDFLNDNAFARLIQKISESYQCIMLDAPSVMSGSEARILGSNADLTLLVIRAGVTDRRDADQALNKLLSVGTRVLGTVLNAFSSGSRAGIGLSPADGKFTGRETDRSIVAAKYSQGNNDPHVDVFD